MKIRQNYFFAVALLSFLFTPSLNQAGSLNLPAGEGRVCAVTQNRDDAQVVGSLRRVLDQGYNIQNPPFCSQKITFDTPGPILLEKPIILDRSTGANFSLEKKCTTNADGQEQCVAGEIILDASRIQPEGSCAITISVSNVKLRGLTIQRSKGPGICVKQGVSNISLDSIKVQQSVQDGIVFEDNVQSIQLTNVAVSSSNVHGISIGNNAQNIEFTNVSVNNSQRNGIHIGNTPQNFNFNQSTVANSQQNGISIGTNAQRFRLSRVRVSQSSQSGLVFGAGAQNNFVQDGSYHDNGQFGVNFLDEGPSASRNLVSHNALYNNTQGPIRSPNTQLTPQLVSLVDTNIESNNQHNFTLTANLQSPLERLEIYKVILPGGAPSNFVRDENNFNNGLRLVTQITGTPGEQVFLVPIDSDGSTGQPMLFSLTPVAGGNGEACSVTSLLDNAETPSSLRRALQYGYSQNDPLQTICSQKISFDVAGVIRLNQSINLDNTSRAAYILEKGADVSGEIILDGSDLPPGSCVINVDSNQITLRGIKIQNPNGHGICVRAGRTSTLIDQVTVLHSIDGVIVEAGAQNNVIQRGSFHDNSGYGIRLVDPTYNRVSQNALYRNTAGPLFSPATDLTPNVNSALSAQASSSGSGYTFTLNGTLSAPLAAIEVFRSTPLAGSTTNFIQRVEMFSILNFIMDLEAQDGEEIFLVGLAADGTTSAVSNFSLNAQNVTGGQGGVGGNVCNVTSLVDDASAIQSLRWALNGGYLVNDYARTLCSQKISFRSAGTIVLREPINLNNTSRPNFTLEKDATIAGEVVIDASNLPAGSCAITVDANQITLRGITIQHPRGNGVCVAPNRSGALLDQIRVRNSLNGAVVKAGAQGNTIQDGFFHDNNGFGIKLEDATFNRVTQNALYRNSAGPLDSPATNIMPRLTTVVSAEAVSSGSSQYNFAVSGSVPSPLSHLEVFRSMVPAGTSTNFIQRIQNFDGLRFITNLNVQDGEEIFIVGIASNGTTSSVAQYRLSSSGGLVSGSENQTVDGINCMVTTLVDDANTANSIRKALTLGYNELNPAQTFCSEKITFNVAGTIPLREPIVLNNNSRTSYTIEKAAGLTGDIILDASQLPAGTCAITIDANQITLRGITVQNPQGDGICISANRRSSLLDQVTVQNSQNGVTVRTGAQGNTIQNGSFHDNAIFGINLEDATYNRVTQNALYRNSAGPLFSPATQLRPEILSTSSHGTSEGNKIRYTVQGQVANPVNHIEVFTRTPHQGDVTNYVQSIDTFDQLRFQTDISVFNGEELFFVAVANDGTTSAVSNHSLDAARTGGCSLQVASNTSFASFFIGMLSLGILALVRKRTI